MYIADLHIHSRYSRATSKEGTPEHLDLWARRKGIHIVGTGDFTHPAWREELAEKLEPAEDGLYTLKKEYRIEDKSVADTMIPRFVITGEISSIYKKAGRVRKVHNLIILPGLEDAQRISEKLAAIGNIHSDGRPILGLDCHDLLEIVLELCPGAIFVPAHIWTPHFSLFGAFSGFDTIEECFEELTPYIHAVETGLSSDPPMNWRVSALDRFNLISNSDAHSPAKLGREANLLDIELSYKGLWEAVQEGKGLCGTIEFFPEEGKYHYDGHRKCNLCLTPLETERYGGICPVCGRKITVGVSHRIEQLADRQEGFVRKQAKAFESLVPLPEVIGASVGHSAASAGVQREYMKMLQELGPEFEILRSIPLEEIRSKSGFLISEGIGRLRAGKVERIPGFDGEYGTIKLFRQAEIESPDGQMDFFGALGAKAAEEPKKPEKIGNFEKAKSDNNDSKRTEESSQGTGEVCLNEEQEKAVRTIMRRTAVIAGPGTGKTKTLVSHIVYLLKNRKVKPSEITAVTFTNQAAAEMRERVQNRLGKKRQTRNMQIGTFHAICLSFLKEQGLDFTILGEAQAKETAQQIVKEFGLGCPTKRFLEYVSLKKSGGISEGQELPGQAQPETWDKAFTEYRKCLREQKIFDFDDLLLETLDIIEENRASDGWKKHFSYLLVDEFQDISPVQYRLMKAWNQEGRELFVIGDPDQSIYGFRGADAQCFTRLETQYPDVEIIRLRENYRSAPPVIKAAGEVIAHNPGGERLLHPNKQGTLPVRLALAGTEMGEAIFVAKEINRQAGGIGMLEAHELGADGGGKKARGFDEIAVLYRTHRQAELLEMCLKKEGIPYIVAGREDFLKEDTVQGSIAFFRYLENPSDESARGQYLKLLCNLEDNQISEAVAEQMAEKYRPLSAKKKPQKLLELWMEEMHLQEHPGMKKLAGMTVFYQSMADFLNALSLGVESDLKRCGDRHYTSGAVTLMTLHGSKGLEFPVTIIYGARKGMIPFESEKHPADKEEERRLFYVGMTRAKEELILTSSGEQSEFLEGLSEGTIETEKADKRRDAGFEQMSLFDL